MPGTVPATAVDSSNTSSSGSSSGSTTGSAETVMEIHTPSSTDQKTEEQTAVTNDRKDSARPSPTIAKSETKEESAKQEPVKNDHVKDEPAKQETSKKSSAKKKCKCGKSKHGGHKHVKKAKTKKAREPETSEESSDDDSESESDSSDSSSNVEMLKKKLLKAKKARKAKLARAKKRSKKASKDSDSESDSETSDSDTSDSSASSDSDSSSEEDKKKKKARKSKLAKKAKAKKLRRSKKATKKSGSAEADDDADQPTEDEAELMKGLQQQLADLINLKVAADATATTTTLEAKSGSSESTASPSKSKPKPSNKKSSPHYKRVDNLWDTESRAFVLKESAEDDESEFAESAFLVRRRFSWENEYLNTAIDIKSKQLRAALAVVMKDCKSVSLEVKEPTIWPQTLVLYLEELRTYYKKTLKAKIKAEKKRKAAKKLEQQRTFVKALVSYIDEDYAETKKTLYPLLKAGNITFDLLWALFSPNDIAVTSSYGSWEEPRCFKVEYVNKYKSSTLGEWYCMEGRYLEYDGKGFGLGDFEGSVMAFKGPRKITSLATYPLKYHKELDKVKKQILERGEHFVNLEGMQYKFHKGLAFMKVKKKVLKININGRVMIDPAAFRRVNPNYPIGIIKKNDGASQPDSDDSDDDCCGPDSSDEEACGEQEEFEDRTEGPSEAKYKYRWSKNERGQSVLRSVEVDEAGNAITPEVAERSTPPERVFTEDEILLTSPVMLGFSFSEKVWVEFTVSGVTEIKYNEDAFDSLVLPSNQKSIVRAMVESHKSHGTKTIDDVIQGKGKGLVAVLHGPPGTGKTLTAEGIAELLKCPLYMVSVGELGTRAETLEQHLQQILDIAHSWGAVLLLDEADVFLEKREVHDIHRNAMVSIFLRLLEYFQGILFLTTNRVETFDEAFQSRIHVALRYGELTHKAKKTVWKMFLDLVKKSECMEVQELTDHELDVLARKPVNGRQIKNLVRTAQALALNEKDKLTLGHIKRVIDVAETFDRELRGGTGYLDAMRSYT